MAIDFASAQVTGLGPCPKVQPVENFDIKRYLGLWYEIEKYPTPFSRGTKCITATYGLRQDGNISVLNQQVYPNGTKDGVEGVARPVSSGVLSVSFPTSQCS